MAQKINKESLKNRIEKEPDFVNSPEHNYSLKKFLEDYYKQQQQKTAGTIKQEVSNTQIKKLLMLDNHTFNKMWNNIIRKLRKALKINQ